MIYPLWLIMFIKKIGGIFYERDIFILRLENIKIINKHVYVVITYCRGCIEPEFNCAALTGYTIYMMGTRFIAWV